MALTRVSDNLAKRGDKAGAATAGLGASALGIGGMAAAGAGIGGLISGPAAPIGAAIGAVVGGLIGALMELPTIISNIDSLTNGALSKMWGGVTEVASGAWDGISKFFDDALEVIGNFASLAGEALSMGLQKAGSSLRGWGKTLEDNLGGLGTTVKWVTSPVASLSEWLYDVGDAAEQIRKSEIFRAKRLADSGFEERLKDRKRKREEGKGEEELFKNIRSTILSGRGSEIEKAIDPDRKAVKNRREEINAKYKTEGVDDETLKDIEDEIESSFEGTKKL
jgi:hypothetical protein